MNHLILYTTQDAKSRIQLHLKNIFENAELRSTATTEESSATQKGRRAAA